MKRFSLIAVILCLLIALFPITMQAQTQYKTFTNVKCNGALWVVGSSTLASGIIIPSAAITQTATSGYGLSVSRNLANTSTDSAVVYILQDNASDDQAALSIKQDAATTAALAITGAVGMKHSYDTAAYWTATVADAGGVTFDSVSDGTPGFAFSDVVTIGGGYGDTGATISAAGAGQFNSTLTVDGAAALNGGITVDTDAFSVADTTGLVTLKSGATISNASANQLYLGSTALYQTRDASNYWSASIADGGVVNLDAEGTGSPAFAFADAVGVTGALSATSAVIGGGYGDTGATISAAGVGQFNGALTTDGQLTAASAEINGTITLANDETIDNAGDGVIQLTCNSAYIKRSTGNYLKIAQVDSGGAEITSYSTGTAGISMASPTTFSSTIRTGANIGAKNGATVAAVEYGDGVIHQTVLTLTATPITITRNIGDSSGQGYVKLYDFPEGRINVLGNTGSLEFTFGANMAVDGSGDFSMGTTGTTDTTLDGTDVDLFPSTGITDPLVASVGSGSGALAASAQFDGTTTAKDLNLSVICDAGDVTVGDSSCTVTGTVTITWINLGDY